ncbi:MAG: hypothetical protein JW866_04670 [Ignavibacteriales bacterium]|nr:hypothetical protein [Ignavibacteriales bacterium]
MSGNIPTGRCLKVFRQPLAMICNWLSQKFEPNWSRCNEWNLPVRLMSPINILLCGYASKGGKVFIMGDIVDRYWTNSVNDSRTQDLEVMILGSATKYAGESLMGGNFFFGGLHFDNKGNLRLNERPYLGTKMLGGASRGNFLFFDPENRLVAAQYVHGVLKDFSDEEWRYFCGKIKESFELANIAVHSENGAEYIFIEDKKVKIAPENFKLVVPKGGLKGYESH